jgi:hypothetical protein
MIKKTFSSTFLKSDSGQFLGIDSCQLASETGALCSSSEFNWQNALKIRKITQKTSTPFNL